MNISLLKKYAIVCGASQGIGQAVAEQLAILGANTLLLARNVDKLEEVAAKLPRQSQQQHDFLAVDFYQPQQMIDQVTSFIKDNPVHILINNSGGPAPSSLLEADLASFDQAMCSHLKASHLLVKATYQKMAAENYGRVINIISTSVKQPIAGLGVSNTIRGAMASWAKTLSSELGAMNITVNNVLPGYTATKRLDSIIANKATKSNISVEEVANGMREQVPLKRFATAEEIANAVAFLASPAAGYINGISLTVDGGRTKGF